ncbi:MAG: transcriptional coactivator p15/PC4 family protein [Spirochaetaceae bacterium]|nr:transcriptional coactivator p15/PC4 family protein [Spirochaetaceae bacterium]
MADESKTLGILGIDEDGKASVREPVFVNLSSYKNSRYLDLRKFYEKDGAWHPSAKGITLHADQFTQLLKILSEHREEILAWMEK